MKNIPKLTLLLFVLCISLIFTGGALAQADDPTPLEKIEQTPDQILLDTDADREGTVRIINNKFQQKRFNPGSTNKYRFTVDNQSEQQIDIQLNAQVQTPSSDIPIQITTPNNGTFQEKTLQPSEQESYIVEFQAVQTEINTPREVLFTLSENNTNTQTVHNLALTTESGTSSTQTIEPTGERQQLATTVDRFNDSTETERANKSSGIPPIAPDGNDNSIGQIYNFERLLDTNTQNSTKLYPQTDQLNVGFEFGNIPSNNYYTLQTRHLINHTSDIPTYAEVRLVGATGEEIDKDTTYYIGSQHSNTTSFNTQYIQLSEEEADYVRNNGRLYTVFHHPEEKQDNTGEYIPRDSRSPIDLQTGTSGTQYNGTQIDLQVFDLLSSQNPLTYTNSQLNTKDITLKTSDGTILSSPGEFDRGDQIRVEFTVENTGSSVISNQQVYLLENQQSVKNKSITLNPGEEGTITFYLNKFVSGEYTYTTPELDDTVTAVVDTEASTTPADAEITPLSGVNEIDNQYIVETTGTTAELTASDTISDSPIQSYQWTLEDETMTETQTGETFSYSFAQKGQYSLELAVETEETTSYTNVRLNVATLPPEAEVGDDIVVSPGEEIRFNGTGSSHPLESATIDTYQWNFGNGETETGSSVKYSYSEEGTYEAQLTVVDGNGNNDTATRTITVEGQKPVAKFTTSPDEPVAEIDDVVFNASESFDPTGQGLTQYQWDFGDGETKSREIPSVEHTYSEPGEYEVRLTVSNLTRTETITKTVKVQDKPFDATITGNNEVSWGTLASYNMYDSPDPDELIENVEWTLYEGQGEDRTQIRTFEKREFTYEFEELGDYSLDLYVEGGRFEDSESIDITVNTGPPRAVTVEEEDEIFISQTINFQGQDSYHPLSQVDIANYRWWYDRDGDTQVISDGGGRGNANAVDYQFEVPTQNYTAEDPRTPDPVSLRDPYDVQLEVTDSNGGTDSEDVTVDVVNRGPVIDLPFDGPLELWYSEPLEFEGEFIKHPDSPPVEIEEVQWTVRHPDGYVEHTEDDRDISYLFEDITRNSDVPTPDGDYTVEINVEDEFGAEATTTFDVIVRTRDPAASFTYTPNSPGPSEPVSYDGSSSKHNEPRASIESYEWNFGDGTGTYTESNDSIEHVFDSNVERDYGVELTVVDQFGQEDSLTATVETDAYESCHELLINRRDAPSGQYPIDPSDSGNIIQVDCNMDFQGGGWTIIDKETARDLKDLPGVSVSYNTNGSLYGNGSEGVGYKVSEDEVWTVDDGGDHSFTYEIGTGFEYSQMATFNLHIDGTSWRGSGATSEVRGHNTSQEWKDLNSGGVSGDIALGTSNSVVDSWSRKNADPTAQSRGNSYPYAQTTGSDSSEGRLWVEDVYAASEYGPGSNEDAEPQIYRPGTSTAVKIGWGESGGQTEGWEWEKGGFGVRKPIANLDYFYENGVNENDFQTRSGSPQFNSNRIVLNGGESVEAGDPIDASQYSQVYIDYRLEVGNGSSGSVELEVNGNTDSDSINGYLVNDNVLKVDTSGMSGDIVPVISASGGNTTVDVDRIIGRSADNTGTVLYNGQFNTGTDSWASDSGTLTTNSGWLTTQYSGSNTQKMVKSFSPSLSASTMSYEVTVAAVGDWNGEEVLFEYRDVDGWHTVESQSVTRSGGDVIYDGGSMGSQEISWDGQVNTEGSVLEVRVRNTTSNGNNTAAVAISDVKIGRE